MHKIGRAKGGNSECFAVIVLTPPFRWSGNGTGVYDIGRSAQEVLGLTDGDIQCSAVLMIPAAKSFGRSG